MAEGQTQAAERLGIPLSTIHTWYMEPGVAELRTTAREDVAEQMWIGVQIGVSEMIKGLKDPDTRLRDKTDAASMLAEKYLLLRGEATTRSEHRELLADYDDHERDAIDEWLRSIARERLTDARS